MATLQRIYRMFLVSLQEEYIWFEYLIATAFLSTDGYVYLTT